MGCWCEWRTPRKLRYLPPVIVFLIIAWLYGSFVGFSQPALLFRGASMTELLPFHAMTFLLCASLAQCLLSTESFVPRRKKGSAEEAPVGDDAVETKANGAPRFCRRCNVWKADRTHHCSSCRRCVLKMDHHCVYINKCVGYYNYKFFLQFLGWSAATCLYMASLSFRYILLDHVDHAVALFFHGRLRIWSASPQIVLVFFFGACLGLALFCFFAMHLLLTAFNYSTLEYCEKRRDGDYFNFYNLGVASNVQQVLGTVRELPYWFIPIATPSAVKRGGSIFPTRGHSLKED